MQAILVKSIVWNIYCQQNKRPSRQKRHALCLRQHI